MYHPNFTIFGYNLIPKTTKTLKNPSTVSVNQGLFFEEVILMSLLFHLGIQRHNNISLNSQIMPENDLDCNKSTCSTEKSHSENFRILCPSLHKIKQFSFYIFISYHLLIHNTLWVLIPVLKELNETTRLCFIIDFYVDAQRLIWRICS